MKFWIISDKVGQVIGCEMTRRDAVGYATALGLSREEFSVQWIDVPVTTDSIRRLLGDSGGYATAFGEVH